MRNSALAGRDVDPSQSDGQPFFLLRQQRGFSYLLYRGYVIDDGDLLKSIGAEDVFPEHLFRAVFANRIVHGDDAALDYKRFPEFKIQICRLVTVISVNPQKPDRLMPISRGF